MQRAAIGCVNLLILAIAGVTVSGPSVAQSSLSRIADGDWVWSSDFTQREAGLFGYARGLYEALQSNCPTVFSAGEHRQIEGMLGAISFQAQSTLFFSGRAGAMGGLAASSASTSAQRRQADEELRHILAGSDCESDAIGRLSDNVFRLLTGRTPESGPGAAASTLVRETNRPPASRDYYDVVEGQNSIFLGRAAQTLESHFEQAAAVGLNILVCRYESDDQDDEYELQYYWAMDTRAALPLIQTAVGLSFLESAQRQLGEASGSQPTIHPFLTYGPLSYECPARLDPALPANSIDAPRRAIALPETAGEAAVSVVAGGGQANYDYGPVPDDFVPPRPDPMPAHDTLVAMQKNQADVLTEIAYRTLNFAAIPLIAQPRIGSDEFRMVQEDMGLIYSGTDVTYYPETPRVLACGYNHAAPEGGIVGVRDVYFWDSCRSEFADPNRLRARMASHPLLNVGPPRTECPLEYGSATDARNQPEPPNVEICELQRYTQEELSEMAREDATMAEETRARQCQEGFLIVRNLMFGLSEMGIETQVATVGSTIDRMPDHCHAWFESNSSDYSDEVRAVYNEVRRRQGAN